MVDYGLAEDRTDHFHGYTAREGAALLELSGSLANGVLHHLGSPI